MNSVINILAKNPEKSVIVKQMNDLLTKDERIYLSKEMLKIICMRYQIKDLDKFLYVYPDSSGDFHGKSLF